MTHLRKNVAGAAVCVLLYGLSAPRHACRGARCMTTPDTRAWQRMTPAGSAAPHFGCQHIRSCSVKSRVQVAAGCALQQLVLDNVAVFATPHWVSQCLCCYGFSCRCWRSVPRSRLSCWLTWSLSCGAHKRCGSFVSDWQQQTLAVDCQTCVDKVWKRLPAC